MERLKQIWNNYKTISPLFNKSNSSDKINIKHNDKLNMKNYENSESECTRYSSKNIDINANNNRVERLATDTQDVDKIQVYNFILINNTYVCFLFSFYFLKILPINYNSIKIINKLINMSGRK